MSDCQLEIQYLDEPLPFPSEDDFKRWVCAALPKRSHDYNLCIRLVDREESQSLNNTYRGKDQPTNVLAFPDDQPINYGDEVALGDLAICLPILELEAKQQQKTFEAHCAHLVIHGVLHLLGFDHQTEEQAMEMESREIALLASLGFADPYGDN